MRVKIGLREAEEGGYWGEVPAKLASSDIIAVGSMARSLKSRHRASEGRESSIGGSARPWHDLRAVISSGKIVR
jgi:hypothetical protein